MNKLISRIIIVFCIPLVGCNSSPTLDAAVCLPVDVGKFMGPNNGPKDMHQQREYADLCVRRNAYRYATASGSANEIAIAAVQRCEGPIINIVTKRIPIEKETRNLDERFAEQEFEKEQMLEDAKMYVVQSRAGNCHLLIKADNK